MQLTPELGVSVRDDEDEPELLLADGRAVDTWREDHPYDSRFAVAEYEHDERLVVLREGRDAAGKGGTIKRFPEHLNPRGARVVALGKPSERESTQWCFQRYVQHLPAAGEFVLFDRSWYDRAGVERVTGFATEQRTRFLVRQIDPVRQWELSPMDLASLDRWDDCTAVEEAVFERTDTDVAPWTVVKTNDEKRARLAAVRHVLARFDCTDEDAGVVGRPDPLIVVHARTILEADRRPETPAP